MNYNKIIHLRDSEKTKQMLADGIGMSLHGLNLAIKNKRLTVETLEKIAIYYKKPVSYFFDEVQTREDEHSPNKETGNIPVGKLSAKIEVLTEMINEKDKKIDELNQEIGGLKQKLRQTGNNPQS